MMYLFFYRATPSEILHRAKPPVLLSSILPRATEDFFVGRNVDMFRVIKAIKDDRLVHVSGPRRC
jgi:hypothetical protein